MRRTRAGDFTAVSGGLNEIQGQTHSTLSRDKESDEKPGLPASCVSQAPVPLLLGSAVAVCPCPCSACAENDTAGNCYLSSLSIL